MTPFLKIPPASAERMCPPWKRRYTKKFNADGSPYLDHWMQYFKLESDWWRSIHTKEYNDYMDWIGVQWKAEQAIPKHVGSTTTQ